MKRRFVKTFWILVLIAIMILKPVDRSCKDGKRRSFSEDQKDQRRDADHAEGTHALVTFDERMQRFEK